MIKEEEHSFDLPEDIWERVFTLVGDERSLHPISLTSKLFLSITNRLRTHLTLSSHQPPARLFTRFPNLRRISAVHFLDDLDHLLQTMSLSDLKKLDEIALDCSHKNLSRTAIKNLSLRYRQNLKSLSLVQFLSLERDDLCIIADSFPNLEFLDVDFSSSSSYPYPLLSSQSSSSYPPKSPSSSSPLPSSIPPQSLSSLSPSPSSYLHKSLASSSSSSSSSSLLTQSLSSYPPNLGFLDASYPHAHVNDAIIEKVSSKLKNLRSIRLFGNPFLSDRSLVSLSNNCPNLTSIDVRDCSFIRGNGIEFLIDHNEKLRSVSSNCFLDLHGRGALRCLRLSHMLLPDQILSSLAHDFDHEHDLESQPRYTLRKEGLQSRVVFPYNSKIEIEHDLRVKLEELSIECCWGLSSDGLRSFLYENGRRIKILELIGLSFLSDKMMASVLPRLSGLKSINLSCCCDLGNEVFFEIVRTCTRIEKIEMRKTGLGKGPLPSVLIMNKKLRYLRLSENPHLNDDTIWTIAGSCPNLSYLDLSSCWDLTEEGMRRVGERCPEISELYIKGCTSIKSLGKAYGFMKLKILKAGGSGMDDEGLCVLADSCRVLEDLDLDGCPGVSPVGVKQVLLRCKVMQEIYVGFQSLDIRVLSWILASRLLLRKIVWKSGILSKGLQDMLLSHGCIVMT